MAHLPLFRPLTLSDRGWVDSILAEAGRRGCEYSFSCAYMWAHAYRLSAAEAAGCFAVRSETSRGAAYLFPAGEDPAAGVRALRALARSEGAQLRFYSLTGEDRALLESLYPGAFAFTGQPALREYLYEAESLAALAGRKLHQKRGHVNRFEREHPDWSFEEIGERNLPDCRRMQREWLESVAGEMNRSLELESAAVELGLRDFSALGLRGGLVRAEGRAVAYAFGERLGAGRGDTFDVRVEKAFHDVPGAYAAVNRACARAFGGDVRYINREDDAGDEGLRRAKLSYHPALLLEKFSAVETG